MTDRYQYEVCFTPHVQGLRPAPHSSNTENAIAQNSNHRAKGPQQLKQSEHFSLLVDMNQKVFNILRTYLRTYC